jgi:hypothetical protein
VPDPKKTLDEFAGALATITSLMTTMFWVVPLAMKEEDSQPESEHRARFNALSGKLSVARRLLDDLAADVAAHIVAPSKQTGTEWVLGVLKLADRACSFASDADMSCLMFNADTFETVCQRHDYERVYRGLEEASAHSRRAAALLPREAPATEPPLDGKGNSQNDTTGLRAEPAASESEPADPENGSELAKALQQMAASPGKIREGLAELDRIKEATRHAWRVRFPTIPYSDLAFNDWMAVQGFTRPKILAMPDDESIQLPKRLLDLLSGEPSLERGADPQATDGAAGQGNNLAAGDGTDQRDRNGKTGSTPSQNDGIWAGDETKNYYDVFLAHNSKDGQAVLAIKEQLERRYIRTWLYSEQVPPGRWFQDVIQAAISKVKSAAVFLGPHGVGKWQAVDLRSFISQCVRRDIPVIPVLLPGVDTVPNSLLFLSEFGWVKFTERLDEKDAIDQLEWGITGKKPAA